MSGAVPRLQLSDAPLERTAADLLAIAVSADALKTLRNHRVAGPAVVADLERQRFSAAEGTSIIVRGGTGRGRTLVVLGLGKGADVGAESFRRAADQLVARARDLRARAAAVLLVPPVAGRGARASRERDAGPAAELIAAFVEGAVLASYAFTAYRTAVGRVPLDSILIAGVPASRHAELRLAMRAAEVVARATNQARTWTNEPASTMTPAALAEEAVRIGRVASLTVEIAGPKEIAALEMGALLGVSRGSSEEPRFIRMRYTPGDGDSAAAKGAARSRKTRAAGVRDAGARRSGERLPRLALVGKGITFDSGGLSLKRADGMEHMKRDMAGGAAVIAAMSAIAALKPAVEVHAYVPASENMPSGNAMKPGDVVRTASGKTVEVLNTDAEGRLVLADALAIAVGDEPDTIVDIATLTGSVRAALGSRFAGILGNDRAVIERLTALGEACGERVWELPLVRAYRPGLDSPVADLKNVASEPSAGAIYAALFLEEFVGGRPWAHLDIAGVAFAERDLPYTPRGAVGWGVRLLTRFVLEAGKGEAPSQSVVPPRPGRSSAAR